MIRPEQVPDEVVEVAANDLDGWGAYTKAKNARAALEGT